MMWLKSGMQSDWMQYQVDDKIQQLPNGETLFFQRQKEQRLDCDRNRWCGARPANCRCCLVLLVRALPPGKLTCPLKITGWKMYFLLK